MDSPMRRSGIPIPKSKSNNMKKSLSKSNDDLLSDNIDTQNPNNELDLFTLLEENIALKEKIEDLSARHDISMALEFFRLNRFLSVLQTSNTHKIKKNPFPVYFFFQQFYRKMSNLSGKIVAWASNLTM